MQLALAFLLGVTSTLLLVQFLGRWFWTARPSEWHSPQAAVYRIDLNQASPTELQQLPGIGDSLASRIEQHRRRTGGFRSVDDLRDVSGVGPATVERMRDWVRIDAGEGNAEEPGISSGMPLSEVSDRRTAKIGPGAEPLDVNRATAEQLLRLPGIGPKLSQAIVVERQKGLFRSVDDLKRVSGIGVKTVERLRPFVTVGAPPPQSQAVAARP